MKRATRIASSRGARFLVVTSPTRLNSPNREGPALLDMRGERFINLQAIRNRDSKSLMVPMKQKGAELAVPPLLESVS